MLTSLQDECSFHKWYPLFKTNTIQAIIEEIPENVMKYLLEDGVFLPEEATFDESCSNAEESEFKEQVEWNSDVDHDEIEPPKFPEFSRKLQKNIKHLGGSAFIKLNWSAPTDAAWITASKSLRCSNLEDIYLLLKSSDKITKTLHCLKAEQSEKPKNIVYIVLKKWIDIHPGTEFRCFVAHRKLIGITQRDSEFHGHLSQCKFDIIKDIDAFFKINMKEIFPLDYYVFDVVRTGPEKITLIDIGAFSSSHSEPYLFTWEELFNIRDNAESSDNIEPELRYIGESVGIQPNFGNFFGVPQDVKLLADQYKGLSLMDIAQMEVKLQEGVKK